MITPSIVSKDRTLLRKIPSEAMRIISERLIMSTAEFFLDGTMADFASEEL